MFLFLSIQVMEQAELLRDANVNLLPALLRLQELVSVLFIAGGASLLSGCSDDEQTFEGLCL